MDPIAIVSTVIYVLTEIKAWIDMIEQRKEIIRTIAGQVELISNVLEPLQLRINELPESTTEPLKKLVLPSILALGATLNKVLEHLRIWEPQGPGRTRHTLVAFIAPGRVIAIFEAHQRKISEGINVLQFALITSEILGFARLASSFH